jgi:hypothetical protein
MNKVVLDEPLRSKLHGLAEQIELCDESGTTIGRFLPEEAYRRLIYDWIKSQISDEELERRLNEPGGSSLSEIWEELGQP